MADSEMQRAAEKRKAAASERGPQWIDALRAERHGYEIRGMTDRIAQVDAELEAAGAEPVKPRTRRKAPDRGDD